MTSDGGASNGMGMGSGMGMGRGMGMGMGMGRGMGMGMGRGMGMGNGMGMGMGNGMGMGMGNGMGMGMGAGDGIGEIPVGADGGIGFIRSYYATPMELALLPWTLDFTPDNAGESPFPTKFIINPYQPDAEPLEWTTEDWDPDLRFWTLPFDPHLGEWLRAADRSEPGTLAALELAGQFNKWLPNKWLPGSGILPGIDPKDLGWLDEKDLKWRFTKGDDAANKDAFVFIKGELEKLLYYMQDDRQNYLVECDIQADGLPEYIVHFLGINSFDHPNTLKLIDVGLAMGNVIYMAYKAHYKRVRPSILRPGLTVPFGPPAHPAFPSGHSFLAHFISLLLLEIPGIYFRFGVLRDVENDAGDKEKVSPEAGHLLRKPHWNDLQGTAPIESPLFSIAHRIAVNRERIGVHYPSDSSASRHLAAGIWDVLFHEKPQNPSPAVQNIRIDCPTLHTVLAEAKVEWPTPWTEPK